MSEKSIIWEEKGMSELIFISNKSEAMIFSAMGFEVHIVNHSKEVLAVLENCISEVKVIAFDSVFETIIEDYKDKLQSAFPLFLELPMESSHLGSKINKIREKIKKSIGIDLLSDEVR
mgnify:CR=1 FL=1